MRPPIFRSAIEGVALIAILLEATGLGAQVSPVQPQGARATAPTDSVGVAVFQLDNPGTADTAYTVRCSATGVVTGCSVPSPVAVPAGATRPVRVRYRTHEPGNGLVYLHLEGAAGGVVAGGWYQVDVLGRLHPPAVAPLNPILAVRAGPRTRAFFVVRNPNDGPGRFVLTCVGRGAVSECEVPGSVVVPGDSAAIVAVTFSAADAGSGSLRLSASGLGGDGTGGYAVTSVTPPLVMPRNAILIVPPDTRDTQLAFTIVNPNPIVVSYDVLCDSDDPPVLACSATPAQLTMDPWGSASLQARFSTRPSGAGLLRLLVRGTAGQRDSGWVRVVVPSPAPGRPADAGHASTEPASAEIRPIGSSRR